MVLKDNPKAYAIMGCAMRVHSILGHGFLESAYGDALEIEFKKADIPYVREDNVRIYYDGQPLPTNWRADFTCFDRSRIVELKAIKSITKIEWAQVIHYMRATRIPYALLLNFGRPQLQYDTFDLDKLPTGSVLAPAVQPQIKDSQSQPVDGESKARSPDNSAKRECTEAKRREHSPQANPKGAQACAREPHGSEFPTSKPGGQPKVRTGPEDGNAAQKSGTPERCNNKTTRFLQLTGTATSGTLPKPARLAQRHHCKPTLQVRLLSECAFTFDRGGVPGAPLRPGVSA